MKRVYVTLIAIVRDQEDYIKEWLAFHHLVGVERFIIILHKCRDKTESKIRELPFRDDVHIHHVVDENTSSVQLGAYHWAVQRYGHDSEWLLFIDTDEFFFGTKEDALPKILERYEEYGGLASHSLHFGSSNRVLRPVGSSIEAFTWRKADSWPINRVVKTAIRTKELLALLSPHVQVTAAPVVLENYEPLGDEYWRSRQPVSCDVIRCHHYHTRSMQDWLERHVRGSCNTYHAENTYYDVNRFIEYNTGDMVEDKTILRFTSGLQEILG